MIVSYTGWYILDPIIAIAVAIYILYSGYKLISRSANKLMDAAIPEEEVARIVAYLDSLKQEQVEYHSLLTRMAGQRRFISIHLLVPGSGACKRARIRDRIEETIVKMFDEPVTVQTHLEPVEDPASMRDIGLIASSEGFKELFRDGDRQDEPAFTCGTVLPPLCSMDKRIFRLALPNIITNVTVPLLGIIDIAIAGRLGSPVYIGAIALGSSIFNVIYWNFGFLRMSSSGFAAQAYGARDLPEVMNVFARSLAIGLGSGVAIVLLQYPIGALAFKLVQSGPESIQHVKTYFRYVVWGAPAVLGMYAFKGWFIGMQNARTPMVIAIFNNVLNIVLSLLFVYGFGMKIDGIALGTMLSQWVSLLVAAAFWWRYIGGCEVLARSPFGISRPCATTFEQRYLRAYPPALPGDHLLYLRFLGDG